MVPLLLIGLLIIGFLIFFLLIVRKMEGKSLKTKYKSSARFALGFGIFLLLVALLTWYAAYKGIVYDPMDSSVMGAAIFQLAFKYFGVNGVIGLLVLIGTIFIVWARLRMRKFKQIDEEL